MSWDERTEDFHELKKVKYQDLVDMNGKRPENSGIPSSDLLQRFPISISIENAGGINGRE